MPNYLEEWLKMVENSLLWLRADEPVDLAAVFQDKKCRNALNAKS